MKHAGTIVSKPVFKEDYLQELADTVSGLRKKTSGVLIATFSIVAGAILIKTYMTLSRGWLLADKMKGKLRKSTVRNYPYQSAGAEKCPLSGRAA